MFVEDEEEVPYGNWLCFKHKPDLDEICKELGIYDTFALKIYYEKHFIIVCIGLWMIPHNFKNPVIADNWETIQKWNDDLRTYQSSIINYRPKFWYRAMGPYENSLYFFENMGLDFLHYHLTYDFTKSLIEKSDKVKWLYNLDLLNEDDY